MEFIPGKDLEQLSSQDRQLFQGREGKRLLHEIGRLICLDIVTNNWDRLPVIWHNEGKDGVRLFLALGQARKKN